jgi:hypothetical protein
MKTDLDTSDLDTRLHTAAGSLHDAVADVPLHGPPTSSGRSPIALGAVLLLVAALTTAAVGATRGNDDGIDVSSQPVADVRGLVADPVPEGMAVAWAGEQTSAVVDGSGVNADSQTGVAAQTLGLDTYHYGNASAAAGTSPFATADLVANVWDAAEVSAEAGEAAQISALDGLANTTSASVRGHAAQVCAAPACVADVNADVTTIWWHETETLEVVLASRTLGVDQIVAIAENLEIDADGVLSLALDAVPNLPGRSTSWACCRTPRSPPPVRPWPTGSATSTPPTPPVASSTSPPSSATAPSCTPWCGSWAPKRWSRCGARTVGSLPERRRPTAAPRAGSS